MDIKHSILKNLKIFENYSRDEIYDHRKAKFLQIGRDQGFSKSSSLGSKDLSYEESGIRKLKNHITNNKYIFGVLGLLAIAGLFTLLS